jgi:hypothetical protein
MILRQSNTQLVTRHSQRQYEYHDEEGLKLDKDDVGFYEHDSRSYAPTPPSRRGYLVGLQMEIDVGVLGQWTG